jgi:hypothetical protein
MEQMILKLKYCSNLTNHQLKKVSWVDLIFNLVVILGYSKYITLSMYGKQDS